MTSFTQYQEGTRTTGRIGPSGALASSERIKLALPRSLPDWLLLLSVIWFGSYVYIYLYGVAGLKPLYSYLVLLGITALWLLARLALLRRAWPADDKWLNRFLVWSAIYFGYVVFTSAVLSMEYAPAEPMVVAAQFVTLTAAFLLLMAEPRRLSIAIAAFALLALFGTAVNIVDFIDPTFSDVTGRAAGFYENPTIAGNFIALAMIAGLGAVPGRLRLPFVAACGVGVLVTFSRESWLLWGIAFVWAVQQGHLGGTGRGRVRTLVGAAVGAGIVLFVFSGGLGQLVGQSQLRAYLNDNTLARIGISASVLSGDSAEERRYLVVRSLEEGASAPLLGKGFGQTQNWGRLPGPHNTFLLFFVEGGVIGLAIFVALAVMLWLAGTGVGRIVAGLFIVSSFFSHNNLEQPAIMLMIAFTFAHGAVSRRQVRPSPRRGDSSLPTVQVPFIHQPRPIVVS
jgi:hypothetical protein